jgi:hypothetical protein
LKVPLKKRKNKFRIEPKPSFKIKNPTTLVKTNVQWAFKIAPKFHQFSR